MGKGDKVTDAKQDQQQFNDDYHEIVFGKGSVYDMLIALWQADSSTAEGAEFIQAKADELYDWLGSNIYQKVDYPLEKAIYDYVNSEINKLWNSKFGGK
jgi:hypothetical protein